MNQNDDQFRGLADAGDVIPVLREYPLVQRFVERLAGLTELNAILGAASNNAGTDPFVFADESLRLGKIECSAEVSIPESGPVLVASNHPFGGADAIALFRQCLLVRKDVRIFGNRLLQAVPPLRSCLLPLEIMSGEASHGNGLAIRNALRHLRNGGLVIVFPAGMVSHYQWSFHRVADAPWNPMVGALMRLAGPQVVPTAFLGRNSLLFQTLGVLHPAVRTAMLPREFIRLKGRTLRIISSEPADWRDFLGASDAETTDRLRQCVDELCSVK